MSAYFTNQECAIRPRKFIEISSDMKLDNVVIPKEEKKIYICAAAITHQLEGIQKKNLV